MFKTLLGIFLFSRLAVATCGSNLQNQLTEELQRRNVLYQKIDPTAGPIVVAKQPAFKLGSSKEIVFLIHGFMGTPDEMKYVAQYLARANYTVYLGLIPGFGSSANVANQFGASDYTRWISQEVAALKRCYSKIHLVGFSTGALLAYNYMMTHRNDPQIASVSLISPFFTVHTIYSAFLQTASSLILKSIDLQTMQALTHFPDIQVMIKRPQGYNDRVPLLAANQVSILGREVWNKLFPRAGTPTLAFISDSDRVLNQEDSIQKLQSTLIYLELVHYPESQQVPHHMMTPVVSRRAPEVAVRIRDFVRAH